MGVTPFRALRKVGLSLAFLLPALSPRADWWVLGGSSAAGPDPHLEGRGLGEVEGCVGWEAPIHHPPLPSSSHTSVHTHPPSPPRPVPPAPPTPYLSGLIRLDRLQRLGCWSRSGGQPGNGVPGRAPVVGRGKEDGCSW